MAEVDPDAETIRDGRPGQALRVRCCQCQKWMMYDPRFLDLCPQCVKEGSNDD